MPDESCFTIVYSDNWHVSFFNSIQLLEETCNWFSSSNIWVLTEINQLETTSLLLQWQQPQILRITLSDQLSDCHEQSLSSLLSAARTYFTGTLDLSLVHSYNHYQQVPESILSEIDHSRLVHSFYCFNKFQFIIALIGALFYKKLTGLSFEILTVISFREFCSFNFKIFSWLAVNNNLNFRF